MRKRNEDNGDNSRDKISAGPVTTGSYGISTSSNLTVNSDGAYDNAKEFFPHNNINTKNK